MVRLTCLNNGEYLFGSPETFGWMIDSNQYYHGPPMHQNDPIWMIVKLTFETEVFCPILESHEVWELEKENRIIKSNLTLPEAINIVLPSGEENPKYLDVSLKCLYAKCDEDSYTCLLKSNQWVQICREHMDDFYSEDYDDEDFEEEIPVD